MFLKSLKFYLIIFLPIIFVVSLASIFDTCGNHQVNHSVHPKGVFYKAPSFCFGQRVFLEHNSEWAALVNQEITNQEKLSFQDSVFLESIDSYQPKTNFSFLALARPLIDSQALKYTAVVKIE